tara:strand:+ start:118 stop:249 length:132 start_codon:yes stop_codon:yes gene_type:complete
MTATPTGLLQINQLKLDKPDKQLEVSTEGNELPLNTFDSIKSL